MPTFLPIILAANVALTSSSSEARPAFVIESAVLSELNYARTDPTSFARLLRNQRANYQGNLLIKPETGVTFITEEGVAPVDEAVSFVLGKAAEAALLPAPILVAAAAEHQVDQESSGEVGHEGRDGSMPADRVQRHGGDIYVGEVITYGTTDPADIVRQLIIDDGVADRGHRRLLYDASLRFAGVSCGPHPVYRYMCVVTLGRTPDGRPSQGWTTDRS